MKKNDRAIGMVPFDAFESSRIDTNYKGFGIVLDARLGPVMVDGDGQRCTALPFNGERAFRHFQLQAGSPLRGLLFKDVEFRVDPNSQFNVNQFNCRGALTFENQKLCLIASPIADSFNDDVNLPLPFSVTADDGFPVAFSKWAVGKVIDEEFFELWAFEGQPEKP